MNCYFCNDELTEANRSQEHIIPDALGNNITAWNLLCRGCNNGLASQIDAAFIHSNFYLYNLVLQAKNNSRGSDKLFGITEKGEKVKFGPDMQMDTQVEIALPDGESICFSAPPDKAEKMVRQRLSELKGKYPHWNVEEMIAKATRGQEKLTDKVFFSNGDALVTEVGGPDFFRGIKKIAVNFYLSKGFARSYVQDAINQVKEGKRGIQNTQTFYAPTITPVHELGDREISHVIKLIGDPTAGVLYCYVELFNTNPALILLNRYYYGPPIDEQYCYDVLASRHLEKSVTLPFGNREFVLLHVDRDWHTSTSAQEGYDRMRGVIKDIFLEKGVIE